MTPRLIDGSSPQALEMAKSLGLDTVDLFRFIFDVQAESPVTVTAFYAKFVPVEDMVQMAVLTKRFHLTEIPQ